MSWRRSWNFELLIFSQFKILRQRLTFDAVRSERGAAARLPIRIASDPSHAPRAMLAKTSIHAAKETGSGFPKATHTAWATNNRSAAASDPMTTGPRISLEPSAASGAVAGTRISSVLLPCSKEFNPGPICAPDSLVVAGEAATATGGPGVPGSTMSWSSLRPRADLES